LTPYPYPFYIPVQPYKIHEFIGCEDSKMLNIEQFRYGADNFSYLIYGEKEAMAVDGGAWKEITAFLKKNTLLLKIVTNTHLHYDHTSGNEHLIRETGADFLNCSIIPEHYKIHLNGETILVYLTPGHTEDSISFHYGDFLISGDTLFNGTIGNCFSGNQKRFYMSIKKLMTLPDETVIFAGHDYVHQSLAFARDLEPDNRDVDTFQALYNHRSPVYSTLAEERKINPYLRFNDEAIIKILRDRKLPHATEWDRWNSLMSIE